MGSRELDRRREGRPLYFADDHGTVEPDRRGRDRRVARRFRVHLWAEQRQVEAPEVEVLYVPELSTEGAFIVREPPLELGTRIALVLTLPGQTGDVRPMGRVASMRLTPDNPAAPAGYGVWFTEVSDEDRERIAEYLGWVDQAARSSDEV